MAEFLDTIGLVSGLLGIIQFGMDNFPGDTPPQGATVLIKAQNNLVWFHAQVNQFEIVY